MYKRLEMHEALIFFSQYNGIYLQTKMVFTHVFALNDPRLRKWTLLEFSLTNFTILEDGWRHS